ncbi:MAG: TIGR03862 family flavoprotein [Alphaproteobacteria bacterium]|nr:TIGR03862 family flavoprotein [Alphaproteobacteria bacterium]
MEGVVAIIGAGPAGLAAAEVLLEAGTPVRIFEGMPTPARKFLMAGRGGLNITHSEPLEQFLGRYGSARRRLEEAIADFPPERLQAWCADLGQETFVGTSGRVFPKAMKSSPLLRAWLSRLLAMGAQLSSRHLWKGWSEDGSLIFMTRDGERRFKPSATVFALGGASWPRLGADGSWSESFARKGATITPFEPTNCGVRVGWSEPFSLRFAGQAVKSTRFSIGETSVRGEAIVTAEGLEGGAIYSLSSHIRKLLKQTDGVTMILDLAPDLTADRLADRLWRSDQRSQPQSLPGSRKSRPSLANRLRRAGLNDTAVGLFRELSRAQPQSLSPSDLADCIKRLPVRIVSMAPIDRAISTAGGIAWTSIRNNYSLNCDPGVFVCGEMIDWEAPTGGYLLQACIATGRAAGRGAATFVRSRSFADA